MDIPAPPTPPVPFAPEHFEVPAPLWGVPGPLRHLWSLLPADWFAAIQQGPVVVAGGALRWAMEVELGLTQEPLRDVDLFVQDRDVATRICNFVTAPHNLEQPGRYKWTGLKPVMDLVWGPGGRSRAELWLTPRPTLKRFAEDLIATFDLSAAQVATWWDPERGCWDYAFGEHFDEDVRARRLRLVGKIEDTNVHRLFRFFERGYKPDSQPGGGS